jgi:hypothetical protein
MGLDIHLVMHDSHFICLSRHKICDGEETLFFFLPEQEQVEIGLGESGVTTVLYYPKEQ